AYGAMSRTVVVGPAAVTHGDVQVTVRAEGQRAGVVIGLRLVDFEDDPLGTVVRPVWIVGGHRELRDPRRVIPSRRRLGPARRAVVHVEPPVVGEFRVKRKTEQ